MPPTQRLSSLRGVEFGSGDRACKSIATRAALFVSFDFHEGARLRRCLINLEGKCRRSGSQPTNAISNRLEDFSVNPSYTFTTRPLAKKSTTICAILFRFGWPT
jgi:hypothetical protein